MTEYMYIYQCTVCDLFMGTIIKVPNMHEMDEDLFAVLIREKNELDLECENCTNSKDFIEIKMTHWAEGLNFIQNHNKEIRV